MGAIEEVVAVWQSLQLSLEICKECIGADHIMGTILTMKAEMQAEM